MKKAVCILVTVILCLSMICCAAAENSSEEIDYTTGTPWVDIDLIGNVTADTPADPKDNFALWANKDRILSLKIPEGYLTAETLLTYRSRLTLTQWLCSMEKFRKIMMPDSLMTTITFLLTGPPGMPSASLL